MILKLWMNMKCLIIIMIIMFSAHLTRLRPPLTCDRFVGRLLFSSTVSQLGINDTYRYKYGIDTFFSIPSILVSIPMFWIRVLVSIPEVRYRKKYSNEIFFILIIIIKKINSVFKTYWGRRIPRRNVWVIVKVSVHSES